MEDEKFLAAIAKGNEDDVKEMIRKGQNINVASEEGVSAVAVASALKEPTILEMLLSKRPNVAYKDKRNELPMHRAIEKARAKSVAALLQTQLVDLTYVHPSTGNNFLHDAIWVDDFDTAKLLLETGAFQERMQEANQKGHAPLHLAALRAGPEFVDLLIEHGADPKAKQNTNRWVAMEPAELAEVSGKPTSAKRIRELAASFDAVRFGSKLKFKANKNKENKEA